MEEIVIIQEKTLEQYEKRLVETNKNRNAEVIDFSRERGFYFAIVRVVN